MSVFVLCLPHGTEIGVCRPNWDSIGCFLLLDISHAATVKLVAIASFFAARKRIELFFIKVRIK